MPKCLDLLLKVFTLRQLLVVPIFSDQSNKLSLRNIDRVTLIGDDKYGQLINKLVFSTIGFVSKILAHHEIDA